MEALLEGSATTGELAGVLGLISVEDSAPLVGSVNTSEGESEDTGEAVAVNVTD